MNIDWNTIGPIVLILAAIAMFVGLVKALLGLIRPGRSGPLRGVHDFRATPSRPEPVVPPENWQASLSTSAPARTTAPAASTPVSTPQATRAAAYPTLDLATFA